MRILSFGYDSNLFLPEDRTNEAQYRQIRYTELLDLEKCFIVLEKGRQLRQQSLAGGRIQSFGAVGPWGPAIVAAACVRGIQMGRRFRPDMVEYQEPQLAGLAAYFTSRALRVPLVGGLFNDIVDNETWAKGSIRRNLLNRVGKYVLSQSTSVRCDSSETVARLNAAGHKNVRYVPFYVPWLNDFAANEQTQNQRMIQWKTDPVVLCVARLSEEKNISLLLRAFAQAYRSRRRGRLEIVGDGPLRESLMQEAVTLNVQTRVTWHGSRPYRSLPESYQGASIFALPSDNETSARVLLLSQAARLPTVTTNTSGASDFVFPGRTGYIADIGDVRAYTEALTVLLNSEEIYSRMLKAEEYSSWIRFGDAVITEYLGPFYREVAAHKNDRFREFEPVKGGARE